MSDAPGDADLARAAASLRASRVPAFRVMEVMKAAHDRERAGGTVFHMEVGQPSAGPPAVSYTHLTLPTILRV